MFLFAGGVVEMKFAQFLRGDHRVKPLHGWETRAIRLTLLRGGPKRASLDSSENIEPGPLIGAKKCEPEE